MYGAELASAATDVVERRQPDDRQKQTGQVGRQIDRDHSDTETQKHRDTETKRHGEPLTQRDRQTHTQTKHTQTNKQTHRQTCRQADKQEFNGTREINKRASRSSLKTGLKYSQKTVQKRG